MLGKVSLLQNDNGILDMPVEKMYPHCHPCRRSSQTALNGTVPRSPGGQKCHPVCTRFLTGVHGFPTQSPLRFLPMLCLHVTRQQPESHLLPVLLSLNPTPLPLPVQMHRSLHPALVLRLLLCPLRLAQAADHSEYLTDIHLQAHPVKQAYQGAEISLEPSRVRQCNT